MVVASAVGADADDEAPAVVFENAAVVAAVAEIGEVVVAAEAVATELVERFEPVATGPCAAARLAIEAVTAVVGIADSTHGHVHVDAVAAVVSGCAEGGREEARWNVECFRAMGADDGAIADWHHASAVV